MSEIEILGRDLADEFLGAGRRELEAVAAKFGGPAKDDIHQALIRLARLLARKAHGQDDLEQDIAFEAMTLERYAAASAIILTRAQERLLDRGLQIAGEFAVKAAEILGEMLIGFAVGAARRA